MKFVTSDFHFGMNNRKNCNKELIGAYCYQCGQKARTDRENWKYLLGEFVSFLTYTEKGFIPTSLQMQ